MKCLVIGCGSIGRRHIRNLRALGVERIAAVDPDADRLGEVAREYGITACPSVADGLAQAPEAVLVCTPPHLHTRMAHEALSAGAHVFIEKPIAHTVEGLDGLFAQAHQRKQTIIVGYNLRFHPGLRKLKEMLDHGVIGRPLMIRAEFGQYLPDWRPAQDYRTGYVASRRTGGGIILEASHELDYVRWLGGEVESVWCVCDHLSGLQIDTEDSAAITLRMVNGILAEVHLDCVQRGYTRSCKIIGEEGTLVWEFQEGVRWLSGHGTAWRVFPVVCDPNAMYVEEMSHFLQCVRGGGGPCVSGEVGRRVLEVALAAHQSAATGQRVRLP